MTARSSNRDESRTFAWGWCPPIALGLEHALTLAEVATVLVDRARELFRAAAAGLWLVDGAGSMANLLAQSGPTDPRGLEPSAALSSSTPGVIRVIAARQPLEISARRELDPPQDSLGLVVRRERRGSVLIAPLCERDEVIAVLALFRATARRSPPGELARVRAFGELGAAAIGRARRYDDAFARAQQAAAMREEIRTINERLVISGVRMQELQEEALAVAAENARLSAQAREALRLHEEFLEAAAHELRTPITVIKGRAQALLRHDAREPPVRETLDVIVRQADRIGGVIDDLLTAIGLGHGSITPRRRRFDLGTLARQQIDRAGGLAVGGRFRLQTDRHPVVDADRALVGRVVSVLLETAVDYATGPRPIDVVIGQREGEAIVSVSYPGDAIARERRAHVFDPFYEAVPPGQPGYRGVVKAGLYLSKQIIDAHGGRIGVEGAPGPGTTFTFSLPLAGPPRHSPRTRATGR
jgi:signal transduction histidine kinase